MPLTSFRLPFLYPILRLPRPAVTGGVRRLAVRHGTAVEPIPLDAEPTPPAPTPDTATTSPEADSAAVSTPIDSTMNTAAQAVVAPATDKPPALAPREWTHHFDTHALAASLTSSGFRPAQSATIMKSIRSLLTHNLTLAQSMLVSKSNVSNESYLFHAACAELRAEVAHERKTAIDALRAEGAQIQNSYDELNQRFLGEVMGMKEEMNAMLDERRMRNRMEMRGMEVRVLEVGYKITVMVGAVRGEIEKLRWAATRRGLIAIAALAVFVVTTIRLSNDGHKKEKKKSSGSSSSSSASGNNEDTHNFDNRIVPTDLLAESLANQGQRPSSGASFVSLG